ncbi:MAG: hypothetical protein MR016_09160 [Agathobacter sp.]|nr:hypothetical protein [Agathobacter sp.]
MMEDIFKQHPELLGMDKNKMDFIMEFAQKDKPKNTKDAMPFLIAYMNQAKKQNINFTKPEVRFITEILMQDLSSEERARVQKILNMMGA